MDKKEKYYNFIVDDLVKNTEIVSDGVYVVCPFWHKPIRVMALFRPFEKLKWVFQIHIEKIYGAKLKEESDMVWYLYVNRMRGKIRINV
jgi:hypothetical protein